MEGEITGKKNSPEQVHLKMRMEFSPNEYVTIQQIKSLFSRMSAEQRKGTLMEPTVSQVNEEIALLTPEKATIDVTVIR